MIRLYMDENVHGSITAGLRQRGIDVLTVQEDNLSGLPDPAVLDRASELGRVLFSQDEDLLAEATLRQREMRSFIGVIYAHQHVSYSRCMVDLEYLALAGEPADFADRVQFLPL